MVSNCKWHAAVSKVVITWLTDMTPNHWHKLLVFQRLNEVGYPTALPLFLPEMYLKIDIGSFQRDLLL